VRTVRLVLVTPAGETLGALPPFAVTTPWWQEVEPVVDAARERFGIGVTILRLLEAANARPPGGTVVYLAELDAGVVPDALPVEPWNGALDEQPRRAGYARVGGPPADLDWARQVLTARGLRLAGKPVQVRTWNLSSLWRLPLDRSCAWLKVVPGFLAHEGALLTRLAGCPVPTVLGHEGGCLLLAHVAGEDLYDADAADYPAMVSLLVALQASWAGRVDELLALGVPDARADRLGTTIPAMIERRADDLPADDRATLDRFVRDLPARFDAIAACGVPATLVHGDMHPGNFRGDGRSLTLIDWGDSVIGHPLLDQAAFLERVPESAAPAVRRRWARLWSAIVPGCDPDRAGSLLAPIAAARRAAIYQGFLDAIEPAEHPYHRDDPVACLCAAAAAVRAEDC
jgi:hypothetical protein